MDTYWQVKPNKLKLSKFNIFEIKN